MSPAHPPTPQPLQALLPLGIGFHNAAMEAEDRTLVEGLFREGAVLVLVSAWVGLG